MGLFRIIPMFIVMLLAYNAVLFSVSDMNATLGTALFSTTLMSGSVWTLTISDLFIIAGVVALYIEIFKATRTSMASVIDHTLSTLVFVAFIIEFVIVKGAGSSTFLILGLMSLFDVIAGFTVTIVAARRDFGYNHPDM